MSAYIVCYAYLVYCAYSYTEYLCSLWILCMLLLKVILDKEKSFIKEKNISQYWILTRNPEFNIQMD